MQGWTVLDVGPGMGYFTIPLAKLVGDTGKVIAADLQQKMLDGILKRIVRILGLAMILTALLVVSITGTVFAGNGPNGPIYDQGPYGPYGPYGDVAG
ncbi:class I SAM-dependent methyltransferase [Chloroflexota bacterium]